MKAGTGSRKKPRLGGAKENIGDAKWLNPSAPSTQGDNCAELIKKSGTISIGSNDSKVFQRVTRKRTNADRFVSPRKQQHNIPLSQQSPNKNLNPVMSNPELRRKSARKSARFSMLNPLDIHSAERQSSEENTAMAYRDGLASIEVTPLYSRASNGGDPSVCEGISESGSHQFETSKASINTSAQMVDWVIEGIPPPASCRQGRETELLPVVDLKTEESNLGEQPESDAPIEYAVKDAETLGLGLLLRKKQDSIEDVVPNQSKLPLFLEPSRDTPPKPEEPSMRGIAEEDTPSSKSLYGVIDATMVVSEEDHPGPKQQQRRTSQRLSARRSSRIKCTNSVPSEDVTREAIIAGISAQPHHQADTQIGSEPAALAITHPPSPASLSGEIERAQFPEALHLPVQTISTSIDQERDHTLKGVESQVSDVEVSALQGIESPSDDQLEHTTAEEPAEVAVELAEQSSEETTTHYEPELVKFHSPSNYDSIDELGIGTGTPPTPDNEHDSSSDSTDPDVQLSNYSSSNISSSAIPSFEGNGDKKTGGVLEGPEPSSDHVSSTESSAKTTNESETNVTNAFASETTNSPAGTTTQDTSFQSYDHDDTDMLRNFLTRVKANKAANAKDTSQKRKKSLPHSPLRLPLGDPDGSNDSPSPTQAGDEFDVSLPASSPSKICNQNTPSSFDVDVTQPRYVRRSGRTKLPVKATLAALSFIPVRRIGREGDKAITLKKNEEKELAALTRVNTRKNKGGALFPADVLAKKSEEKDDPASRQRALKEVFDDRLLKEKRGKSRKSVVWAEELAQYQIIGGKNPKVKKGVGKEKGKGKVAPSEKQAPASRVGINSKIALGMAANGTPAPKRNMRQRS